MAVTYGFYNSMGGDRKYSAEQMSSIFDGVIVDGVYAGIGNKLTVSAGTGLQVLVKSGRAWFNHTWTLNDADYPLAIAAPDKSLKRIDRVVLEIDARNEARVNTFKVVKGIPNSNPQPPAVTNTDQIHQHILAEVTVDANTTSIPVGNIKQIVGTAATPFVTSVLQQTNIDVLYNEWRGKFDAWFSNVQAQLAGNVATNLQKQIDQCNTNITTQINGVNAKFASYVPIANKASAAEVNAGTNDAKWVTPKAIADKVKSAALGKPTLLGTYSGSGNLGTSRQLFLNTIDISKCKTPSFLISKVTFKFNKIGTSNDGVILMVNGGLCFFGWLNMLPTSNEVTYVSSILVSKTKRKYDVNNGLMPTFVSLYPHSDDRTFNFSYEYFYYEDSSTLNKIPMYASVATVTTINDITVTCSADVYTLALSDF